ncbi:MAG: replication-associated recombination protein A [Elusimicrobia bacterium]|nr:replication-associated recombination protein A [Elusimicrobiota bacterium]
MDELFEKEKDDSFKPLPWRIAPKTLEEFFGQEHLFSEGKFLKKAVEKGLLKSALFYGPSGSGKTALASLIAERIKAKVFNLNAACAGVAEIKKTIEAAKEIYKNEKTLVILDEIHHFNKTQQDTLLPSVEKGEIILIGLTTENPFFYINRALLSRFLIFEFKSHNEDSLRRILARALKKGFPKLSVKIKPEAEKKLISLSAGDARRMLNLLESAALAFEKEGNAEIDCEMIKQIASANTVGYDKKSDNHYDHASAFIKSMRGSDPDASVYWLAKMLEGGEDPLFLARRILICASEDVGNANPMALVVANSAFEAVKNIGMPEARIILSQAAIYVAVSPKSNSSYKAINEALKEVKEGPQRNVPLHLKDSTGDGKFFGDGRDYKYPHDYANHFISQEYMPLPKTFYEPSDQGFETEIKKRLEKFKK